MFLALPTSQEIQLNTTQRMPLQTLNLDHFVYTVVDGQEKFVALMQSYSRSAPLTLEFMKSKSSNEEKLKVYVDEFEKLWSAAYASDLRDSSPIQPLMCSLFRRGFYKPNSDSSQHQRNIQAMFPLVYPELFPSTDMAEDTTVAVAWLQYLLHDVNNVPIRTMQATTLSALLAGGLLDPVPLIPSDVAAGADASISVSEPESDSPTVNSSVADTTAAPSGSDAKSKADVVIGTASIIATAHSKDEKAATAGSVMKGAQMSPTLALFQLATETATAMRALHLRQEPALFKSTSELHSARSKLLEESGLVSAVARWEVFTGVVLDPPACAPLSLFTITCAKAMLGSLRSHWVSVLIVAVLLIVVIARVCRSYGRVLVLVTYMRRSVVGYGMPVLYLYLQAARSDGLLHPHSSIFNWVINVLLVSFLGLICVSVRQQSRATNRKVYVALVIGGVAISLVVWMGPWWRAVCTWIFLAGICLVTVFFNILLPLLFLPIFLLSLKSYGIVIWFSYFWLFFPLWILDVVVICGAIIGIGIACFGRRAAADMLVLSVALFLGCVFGAFVHFQILVCLGESKLWGAHTYVCLFSLSFIDFSSPTIGAASGS
jgi:hypothetical protein